jgi:hypothetical protein
MLRVRVRVGVRFTGHEVSYQLFYCPSQAHQVPSIAVHPTKRNTSDVTVMLFPCMDVGAAAL